MGAEQRVRRQTFTIIRFIVLLLILVIFFLPLVSMFMTSLKNRGDLYRFPPNLLPETPQWEN